MTKLDYKYLRIQGKNLVRNTMYARGVFSVCMQLLESEKMEQEDADLFKELNNWFLDNLPLPPQCNNQDPVICRFKTENSDPQSRRRSASRASLRLLVISVILTMS
ncbi:MAG: hypothetical protein IKD94_06470 [Erysipelotrichaceae bacterium]|nr:hypothetical protein [Erysipelotrichaceae bacterium]